MSVNTRFGQSTIEYLILTTIIVAALVVFKPYIRNAIEGYYHKSGDTFAFTRQHGPTKTRDCLWDDNLFPTAAAQRGMWYSEKCFDHQKIVQACTTAMADNPPGGYSKACAQNAQIQASCSVAPPVGIMGICGTSCCLTDAKVACAGPCSSMPRP